MAICGAYSIAIAALASVELKTLEKCPPVDCSPRKEALNRATMAVFKVLTPGQKSYLKRVAEHVSDVTPVDNPGMNADDNLVVGMLTYLHHRRPRIAI